MSEFVRESYTNEFGQVLNPGDDVVFVATGYSHSVSVERGKFAGVRKEGNYVVALSVEDIPYRKFVYDYETRSGEYVDITRKTSLPMKRVYKLDMS